MTSFTSKFHARTDKTILSLNYRVVNNKALRNLTPEQKELLKEWTKDMMSLLEKAFSDLNKNL